MNIDSIDVSAPARAHPGQHALDQRDETEKIGLEHSAHSVVLALLYGREVAVAGIVDEDIDAAKRFPHLRDSLLTWRVPLTSEAMVFAAVGYSATKSSI